MSVLYRPLTYDDLAQMPDDGKRYEVIDGELLVNPSPAKPHQKIQKRLGDLLLSQEKSGAGEVYFAPVDVRLSPYDIVQPDLLFLLPHRSHIYHLSGVVEGPPDIVVEILSPSTRNIDQIRKAALYARGGVPEYWIADPDTPSLTIFTLRQGQYHQVATEAGSTRSLILPDLTIDLDALFQDLSR